LIGLDTSVLVRYFTQDDAVQGPAARRFLQETLTAERRGHVSLVTLAELAWVLRSRYRARRDEIIDAVEALIAAPNMRVQDENAVWVAIDECQRSNVGLADALIAAVDNLHGCTHTVTFDDKATRNAGMKRLATP
jgi:predicted nucleic-acid-binding protein